MIFNRKFILASSSKSRYKILKNNNLNFFKINPTCDEERAKKKLIKTQTSPQNISIELARLKSKSISKQKNNYMVVGCDTIIDFNGEVLNKAKNTKDAKTKILKMSGRTHIIYSGLSIFFDKKEIFQTFQKTSVKIRNLTEKDVDWYVSQSSKNITHSVGCYQIESLGPNIIESISGDFFNVMGFPLFPFLKFLKKKAK